jgi:hypothetical protein
MSAAKDKSDRTVRITVKVRPDEYDKFFRHVRHIGSTMSAFFRESAAKAMQQDRAGQHDSRAHVDEARDAREYRPKGLQDLGHEMPDKPN